MTTHPDPTKLGPAPVLPATPGAVQSAAYTALYRAQDKAQGLRRRIALHRVLADKLALELTTAEAEYTELLHFLDRGDNTRSLEQWIDFYAPDGFLLMRDEALTAEREIDELA